MSCSRQQYYSWARSGRLVSDAAFELSLLVDALLCDEANSQALLSPQKGSQGFQPFPTKRSASILPQW